MLNLNLPAIDTGMLDFSPKPVLDKKLEELRQLPVENITDLLEWAKRKRPFLGPGRKFDIDSHQYLKEIYRQNHREAVFMKASQMGLSEYLVSYAIHACDQRLANVLYVFPTEAHVSDFSTARLGPAIESSEYLSKIIIDGSGSGGMRGSDRITLKRIRDRFLYFRGSKVQTDGKAPQLKSIDADVLILDEVDELDPRAPAIARKRLGHARSDLGNILWVSTPTYPGAGIHEQFLESDQRIWHLKCDRCNTWQPLEIGQCVLEWDDLGRPVEWRGKKAKTAWIGCVHCGRELNRLKEGEWVARYPDNDRKAGYHMTKLFSAQTPLLDVVEALDTVDETKRREAFNQDLGVPYTPRGGSLDAETLDSCRRDYGHGPNLWKTCYMGVDIGRVLHVVIRTATDFETGETLQLYAGETTWEHLHNLVKIYRPRVIVTDALPETTKAREFQASYPRNMVWIAYYHNAPQGSKREQTMVWNPRERTVQIERTRILDEVLAGFYGRKTSLPGNARHIRDYYSHLCSTVRVLKEDGNGVEVARYVENGADHFLHAEVYAMAASQCRHGQGWVEGME